jgi:hypothetical protein
MYKKQVELSFCYNHQTLEKLRNKAYEKLDDLCVNKIFFQNVYVQLSQENVMILLEIKQVSQNKLSFLCWKGKRCHFNQ